MFRTIKVTIIVGIISAVLGGIVGGVVAYSLEQYLDNSGTENAHFSATARPFTTEHKVRMK